MPVALDLSGVSLAEGLRAAVASGLVLLLSLWFESFPLLLMAFAANLTCFCDTGGLLRSRVRALLFFTVAGALLWSTFGLLRGFGWPVVVPCAGVVVFLCSMARVWGLAAQAVGNVLIVVLALALDQALSPGEAGVLFVSFIAGGLWAVLLTLVIWRINTEAPVLAAVGLIWRNLSLFAKDLRRLMLDGRASAVDWEAHARAHRRATRAAIEDARPLIAGTIRSRGPTAPVVRRMVIRFEAAESIFAGFIALSDILESIDETDARLAATRFLRLLRPVLVLLQQSSLSRLDRFQHTLERAAAAVAGERDMARIAGAILDGIRIALRAEAADMDLPQQPSAAAERRSLSAYLAPFRDNLTWTSAVLRHATRATALTVPAMAWSIVWWSPYAHWLTITVALTMQPYFAATWQRAIERIGGTILGGLIGAALAFLPQTTWIKPLLLIPLCVVGFSVRQVSYGAYIACLTPLVVVLFDFAVPGHSDATIAGMRLLYTVLGGILALAGCMMLWPTWEPDRLREEMRNTLLAHAALADAVFATGLAGHARDAIARARSAAGVANNNLEASLSRSLQEPRRSPALETGLVVDAALRRIGGALITLEHEAASWTSDDQDLLRAWQRWIVDAMSSLARGAPIDVAPPAPENSTLARLKRAVELIASVVDRNRNATGSGVKAAEAWDGNRSGASG